MSRWMRLDLDFVDHPKLRRLAHILDISRGEASYVVLRTWSWLSRFCPTGQIRDMDGTDLELSCDWSGERGQLLSALVESGWLSEWDNDGTKLGWEAHDWADHQGKVAAKASKEKERKRAYREKLRAEAAQSVPRDNDGTSDGTNRGRAQKRNETKRDETIRIKEECGEPEKQVPPPPNPPKPKPQKATDPRHQPLVERLVQVFQDVKGAKYPFGPRDARHVSELLSTGQQPDGIADAWKRALTNQGFPTVATLSELVSHFGHFVGSRPHDLTGDWRSRVDYSTDFFEGVP